MSTYTDEERERAQQRYVYLQLTRFAAIGAVLLGIAIARAVVPAPYWLGVALAVGGLVAFFFGPPLLARRFKARDTHLPEGMDKP
ncbi:hypothetical protein NAP1_00485 [Erythrobacter sp. NAP1]|uniref:hypothetical protein n=1 Tax=Erythrobacter sp. NAP1 TaxID=237727 RepID=UPI0000686E68|nr:hypothetical protein [Erythrobacter sp. NAP1]EAQ29203.1 hypothetical protein NAP1_00485 [Erythrobacter sp. NAP1]